MVFESFLIASSLAILAGISTIKYKKIGAIGKMTLPGCASALWQSGALQP
jgi:hypothetical protein